MIEEEFNQKKNLPKWKKFVRMALPHVGLAFCLFGYLCFGAYSFYLLEYDTDAVIQRSKLKRIKKDYTAIRDEVQKILSPAAFESYEERLFEHLNSLSTLHEGRPFNLGPAMDNEDALPPRWNRQSSFLYALSILTTTGYSYAVPTTWRGYCFSIVYGLIGIPLLILAAVDIGRFLSLIVLRMYSNYLSFRAKIRAARRHLMFKRQMNASGKWDSGASPMVESPQRVLQRSRPSVTEDEGKKEEQRLPLLINASILLVFCMLGGFLYIAAGGKATFMEAFFVTFNLVANLTMSDMPNDMNHILTIIYIFVFVTCGVAVLSMSAELAALELKEMFIKIHYFGRKINFKRSKKKEQMEVEVNELLKIIEEIRKRYPDKERITTMDILQYMHETSHPSDKLQERRDTIAFMPQTMEMLKFADEQDMEDRSVSRIDETPLLDKNLTVNMMEFCEEDNVEEGIRKHISRIKMVKLTKSSTANV